MATSDPLIQEHNQRAFGVIYLGLSWAYSNGHEGHLSAEEIIAAIAWAAEDRWGLLAHQVLDYLDVGSSEAIGDVIQQMVGLNLITTLPNESVADFYDTEDISARLSLRTYPWQVNPSDLTESLS